MSQTYPNSYNQDWGLSRIGSTITYGASMNITKELDRTNIVTINIINNNKIKDALNKQNCSYIHSPQRFTWSLTLPGNSYTLRLMRALAAIRLPFHIELADAAGTEEYKGVADKMMYCQISEFSVPFRIGDEPAITITGKALRYAFKTDFTDTEFGHVFGDDIIGDSISTATETTTAQTFGNDAEGNAFWS